DKFEIIDVEFPQIPTDVVYNADKATYKPAGAVDEAPNDPVEDINADSLDDDLPPPDDRSSKIDLNDVGDEDLDMKGDDMGAGPELSEPEGDAEGVEDFIDAGASGEESILDRVLAMLKAQAEAEA